MRHSAEAIHELQSGDDSKVLERRDFLKVLALIGADLIKDKTQREKVTEKLKDQRTLIELSAPQIAEFAGNAIELDAGKEKLLVLSERACQALTEQQRNLIERYARIVPLSLPTIELAGGSARCMIAEIFLPPRQ